jgi:hypothetical protein
MQDRLDLYENGSTTAEADLLLLRRMTFVSDLSGHLAEWPMRMDKWPFDFSDGRWRGPQFYDQLASMRSVLQAVVWELWCDYGTWPMWEEVASRISTWLGTDFGDSDLLTLTAINDPGITVEAPYHLPGYRSRRTVGGHAWRIASYEDMVLQERARQWRIVLGDVGFRWRTGLTTMLVEYMPDLIPPYWSGEQGHEAGVSA